MARWGSSASIVYLKAYNVSTGAVESLYSFDFNNVIGINLSIPKWTKEGQMETAINGKVVEMIKGFRFMFSISYELEKGIIANEDCYTFIERMIGWNYKISPFSIDSNSYRDTFINIVPHSDNADFNFNVHVNHIESKYLSGLMIGYQGVIDFISDNLYETIQSGSYVGPPLP